MPTSFPDRWSSRVARSMPVTIPPQFAVRHQVYCRMQPLVARWSIALIGSEESVLRSVRVPRGDDRRTLRIGCYLSCGAAVYVRTNVWLTRSED